MDKEKLFAYINKYGMIKKGDTVIAALSGGADSMALFHFLLNNKEQLGITLCAAHINHKMREESDAEALGVKSYCEQCGVRLYEKTLSPPINPSEDWARQQRYAFFDEISHENSGAKIATAHTSSDNAETLLFRLCRGTALRGAGGIPPVRGVYIRPLLCCTREEIERYCAENSISFFIDKTNLTSQYTRGKIRNETFVKLNEVHPAAKQAFARFAESAREAQEYIDKQALCVLQKAKTGSAYSAEILSETEPVLLKAAFYLLLSPLSELDEKTVNLCCGLLRQKSGSVNLPKGRALVLQNNKIYVSTQKKEEIIIKEQPLRAGNYSFYNGKSLQVQVLEYEEFLNYLKLHKKSLIFSADYGKIQFDACFRSRRAGDTFALARRRVTKSVKKLMNEKGVLCAERDSVPLLASQSRVLWMWGEGFCGGLEVSAQTEKVLVLTINSNSKEI